VSGPGNNLDGNYNYSIEKDINFIAERTANTNVGFVNFFQRHDKPWLNRRVGSMNLEVDQALMRGDMPFINVTDASSFVRKDFTRHGLHLNSQGKKRLMQLLAERVVDGRVSSTSSIPATAFPSLAYIKCVSAVSEAHKQDTEPSNLITIFH
jgi:hypothetical protein